MVDRSPSPLITPLLIHIDENYKKEIRKNFETLEIIGYGSFGVVSKVKEKSTHDLYALKTIVFNQQENEDSLKNGLKEVGILSRCDHPNIIKFYGFEVCENSVTFLMELMECNLEHFIKEKAELVTTKFIIEAFFSLLDSLNYLHQKFNIIHRDIKPQNILINHNHEIKLSDFGTVKGRKGTITEKIVGSKYFLAPELYIAMRKSKNFEATVNYSKCDVFSLGLTILRIITNEDFVKNNIVLNYNEADLENYLLKHRNKIPLEIFDTLLLMLRFNVDLRPDIPTLYKIVNFRKEVIFTQLNKVRISNFFLKLFFKQTFFKGNKIKIEIVDFNKLKERSDKNGRREHNLLLFEEDEVIQNNEVERSKLEVKMEIFSLFL